MVAENTLPSVSGQTYRMYDMAAITTACGGFDCAAEAIEAVLAYDPADSAPVASARTLYFPAGNYELTYPIEIATDGVVLRGEGGFAEDTEHNSGTVLSCRMTLSAVLDGDQACITIRNPSDLTNCTAHQSIQGVGFERIQMRWAGTVPDKDLGQYVAGVRIRGGRGVFVRDSSWIDFPGTSILIVDNSNPIELERLRFYSTSEQSIYAVYAAGTKTTAAPPRPAMPHAEVYPLVDHVSGCPAEPDPKNATVLANNSLHLSNLTVQGYQSGVVIVNSTQGTLEDSQFVEQTDHAVLLLSVFGWNVRGCTFRRRQGTSTKALLGLDGNGVISARLDVVVSDCLFDTGCQTGRPAIEGLATFDRFTWGVPRVCVSGCTFVNQVGSPLRDYDEGLSGSVYVWQCTGNRITSLTDEGPPRTYTTVFFGLEECAPTHSIYASGSAPVGYLTSLEALSLPSSCTVY